MLADREFTAVSIKDHCYEVVDWEFFEEEVGQRVRLVVQVTAEKEELLDVRNAGHCVKIPQVLWGKEKERFGAGSVNIEIINGKKSKRRGWPKKKEIGFLDSKETLLRLADYRDSISICIDGHYGYSKIYDLVKLPVNISNNDIDLNG